MKKTITLILLFITILGTASAQTAYNQLKNLAGTNVSVPKASDPVCAYCGVKLNGTPHKSTCPYATKSVSTTTKTSGTSIPSGYSGTSVSTNTYLISTATSLLGDLLTTALSANRQRQITSEISKQEGNGDGGFYVTKNSDGYYSIWDDNQQKWIMTPEASIMTRMYIYDCHAACIQRWTGKKWGIADLTRDKPWAGKFFLWFQFDDVKCVDKEAPIGVAKGKKNPKWGLVTKNKVTGNWSMTQKPQFSSIQIVCVDGRYFAICEKDGLCALIDLYGNVLIDFLYKTISPAYADGGVIYFAVEGNDGWGLVDEFGKELMPCIYESITIGENGLQATPRQ